MTLKVFTKYYSSTTLYSKVLFQFYSTTTTYYYYVLPCTSKYYSTSTLYYKVLPRTTKFYSALQSTTPAPLCTMYYKILLRTEASYMKWRSTGVIVQLHQILRLPHKMTRMPDPRYMWNVIYDGRWKRCHLPTSPTPAPAQVSPSELTNYCASQAKRLTCLISVTHEK